LVYNQLPLYAFSAKSPNTATGLREKEKGKMKEKGKRFGEEEKDSDKRRGLASMTWG